jgi:hypothetical protein
MCVQVRPSTSAHCPQNMQWVEIRIRGVGAVAANNPVVVANNVVDARGHFPSDDSLSSLKPERQGAALDDLDAAAQEIEQKLNTLHANAAAVVLFVQCAEGRSRSSRCVGAYLIRTLHFTSTQAVQFLEACYNSPRVDHCPASNFSKPNVEQWLFQYADR